MARPGTAQLHLSTSAVQQAVVAQGSCVIVGRAADYVLRDREDLVRVFIHAPKEYRVKKVMEMYGDSRQEGERRIARSDAARGAYYKSVSGREWGSSHQYELCVDSSVGVERTADLIVKYLD